MKMVIHPGFAKTATTTLQNHFFSTHLNLINLAQPYTADSINFGIEIKKPAGQFDKEKLQEYLNINLKRGSERVSAAKRTIVLSDESLSVNATNRVLVAERLRDLIPDATIIFTIRNQLEWVKSLYASGATQGHFLARYKFGRYASLDDWLQFSMDNWHQSLISSIEYDQTIRHYEKLYGRERIHVLLYEDLAKGPAEFMKRLCEILAISPDQSAAVLKEGRANPRPTRTYHVYHKLRHWVLPDVPIRKLLPGADLLVGVLTKALMRGAPLTVEIPPKWEQVLRAKFAEGNRELARRYGLPLRELGYPFAESPAGDHAF